MIKDNPNQINKIIGEKIKFRRKQLGYSLEDLSEYVQITLQQVRKYELGINKIDCAKIILISRFLRVPVTYFLAPAEYRHGEFSLYFDKIKNQQLQGALVDFCRNISEIEVLSF